MKTTAMRRREFLKLAGLGAAAAAMPPSLFGAWPPEIAEDAPRPNILWISAEDLSPTMGCYGDDYATTPKLDAFAAEGVRYDRAFAHAPVCAPARSGLITGMYSTSIGTTWMRCGGVPPWQARCFPEYLRAAGYFCTNNAKTDYQFGVPASAWHMCSGQAHWKHRRRKDQPFFAVFNLGVTHESSTRRFKPGQQFDHDPAEAPVPPYYPDTQIVRENLACYYDRVQSLDGQVQGILDELEADGLAENTVVWFWGDHGWGLTRGKRWVYDSGIRVPLVIRVPEKFRKWAGGGSAGAVSPGRAEGEIVSFIDFAPTMLSLAGVQVPEHMQGQAFLGPQKAPPRDYAFAARDRMDETYDFIRAVRDKKYKYIRNYMPWLTRGLNIDYMDRTPILQEMRRLHEAGKLEDGPQMQFFEPTKPVRELYDIEADPHEVHNLADQPKYAEVVERMDGALKAWMKRIGDVGFIPESDFDAMKDRSRTGDPVFTPAKKADDGTVAVTLSCPTKGASIVYRVDEAPDLSGEGKEGGPVILPARKATIHGGGARKSGNAITHYKGKDTTLSWTVRLPKPGKVPVYLLQANAGTGGSEYELSVGDRTLKGTIRHTDDWDEFLCVKVGEVDVPEAGKVTVTIRPTKQVEGRLGNIQGVVLYGDEDVAKAFRRVTRPWALYTEPVGVKPGERITAKACRIGYGDSGTVSYNYGDPATRPGPSGDPEVFWREEVDRSGMLDRCRALKAYDGRWGEGVELFIKSLADEASPVRYWAVVGLQHGCEGDGQIARAAEAVAPLLKDDSDAVRVAAAEAFCTWGRCDAGLPVLVDVLRNGPNSAPRFAAWALWHIGEKARPALAEMEKGAAGGRYPNAVLKRVVARLKKG